MWFLNKELAFANGSSLSLDRLGIVAGGFFLPYLYNVGGGLFLPLLATALLCAICWFCGLIINLFDKKCEE